MESAEEGTVGRKKPYGITQQTMRDDEYSEGADEERLAVGRN